MLREGGNHGTNWAFDFHESSLLPACEGTLYRVHLPAAADVPGGQCGAAGVEPVRGKPPHRGNQTQWGGLTNGGEPLRLYRLRRRYDNAAENC